MSGLSELTSASQRVSDARGKLLAGGGGRGGFSLETETEIRCRLMQIAYAEVQSAASFMHIIWDGWRVTLRSAFVDDALLNGQDNYFTYLAIHSNEC